MKNKEKIDMLIEAYRELEEYTCLLVGSDCDTNEIITHCNKLVDNVLQTIK